ncbi:hypothetical protein DXG01_007521, partial [Tephrocybe rancida]
MGRRRWATQEQLAWLGSKLNDFIEHQKKHDTNEFWSVMESEWYARWPSAGRLPTDPTNAGSDDNPIAIEKRRLKEWFNNNSQKMRKQAASSGSSSKYFFAEDKNTRAPHATELWAKKYYDTKVKHLVDAELEASDIPRNKSLAVIKRNIRAVFDAEPEEIRNNIYMELEEAKNTAKAKAVSEELEERQPGEVKPDPAHFASGIERLPDAILRFTNAVQLQTGFHVSIFCGGPDPVNDGRIRTVAHHAGTNPIGHNFGQAQPGYKQNFLKPYTAFLNSCFPSADKEAHTLYYNVPPVKPTIDPTPDKASLSISPTTTPDPLANIDPALRGSSHTATPAPPDSLANIDPALHGLTHTATLVPSVPQTS